MNEGVDQLPSYEHIERERSYYSLTSAYTLSGAASNHSDFVFPMQSYAKYPTPTTSSHLVHSFTDDFAPYQVIKQN